MKKQNSRRTFIASGFVLSVGASLIPAVAHKSYAADPVDSKLVNEFVRIAHSDLNKLKEMLETTPNLLNAAWDWGNGDFETAIGAAGHMGLTETADYLIAKGARTDIFVLTMLGKTAIVKSLLSDYPNLLYSKGPHGLSLLHHAEKGGKKAEELLAYFQSLGLKEKKFN
ncbi:hypothetical protein [Emticicia sp. BO119]|uniref:hypothetical protein n=1 Tax=Emticicia sp. BO119 TaxID=2757768 RepID=UPI001C6A502B|nr:hypothetical protein [Emticicia sp. BO119]